jgi:hypothetical protein
MASIPIQSTIRRALDLLFSRLGELLRPGTYTRLTGYVTDLATGTTSTTYGTASVQMLIIAYQSRELDGSSIKYGDEKVLIRASELSAITNPAQDDWIIDATGNRRDIKAAFLDSSQQLWIFQTRRALPGPISGTTNSLDWGEIALQANSDEGWGDLSLATSSEDWNT